MDTQQQRNERMETLGRPGMPMIWIVLAVIGLVLLVGWLALGRGGPRTADGVGDPMIPAPVTPEGTPGTTPPPPPPTEPDPWTEPDPTLPP